MKQLLLLFVLGLASCAQVPDAADMPKDPKALPPIILLKGDTVSKYSTDSLAKGRPTLLYYYGPACLPCDTLTQKMLAAIDTLKDVNIFFLSAGSFHDVKLYEKKYGMEKFPNVQLGLDYNNTFFRYYGGQAYPLLVFYDKERQIKRANLGSLPIDTIRAIIDK
ncbi:TlpA family protein disulfide reductase [Chitinophaga rhizophila]|uniref:Thioredoxin family protein n=1 Tax=Chitinophaga rhizophila TaxID=2866212 RepID=A0ABS7GKC0_9BACT|nr:thioredoxin family protein [Chitinophaga rhizophila]MBW8688166.1 thioredoxin family protein [Chitinophaga rhizophila]